MSVEEEREDEELAFLVTALPFLVAELAFLVTEGVAVTVTVTVTVVGLHSLSVLEPPEPLVSLPSLPEPLEGLPSLPEPVSPALPLSGVHSPLSS